MRVTILICALLFAPWAAAQPPVVLVFGDSLSAGYGLDVREGWVALLQQRLQRQGYPHAVVNASVSGETTAGGRTRLSGALQRHRPQLVILELGANDGLRGLSLTQTRDNLAAMVRTAQRSGARVLLIGIHLPPNYGPDYTRKFHDIFGELARRYQAGLVPFLLEGVALDRTLMQADGLHPRAAAQPRILDNVWPSVEGLLKPRLEPVAGQQQDGS
jgi:acyl-CoA thioesterase-1